ncbi:sigma-70 family RNA polymerase sigma factor [Rheinheimera mesophila]|uniref:Sigma-70 family RNA polymerase sigma factor n=1 Tax=Rheinheimera mesophila TaxID=1547515 RepID=A0A3P3QBZ8_9GAMM|nr:sigma-70 family RNA polymerase sigma factor [Rheinheimera mesophila]KKL02675.1 RNA polymerase sigma-70 factor [Rheinheimera mesophila]RRJ18737.1 sigma-70 family RNA polymerase sigma factor [Rheinheimera mesophila]
MLTSVEQKLLPDVLAATAGDRSAFERLITQCRHTVTGIALAIVKDLDASEEVAQEVFIHIWQQLATLREPASFLPWVRQMTRHRSYNYLRDNKVKQKILGEEAESLLENFADPTTSMQDVLEREQQQIIMQDFISQLPEDSREIVLLYYREEQSSQQVADLLGLSDANVRKKLSRVREQLKDNLLTRYGQLVLSTAPGLGFSAMVAAALTSVAPPVAAATSVSVAAQHSGWLAKIAVLLGGAMIGALAAVAGVILAMKPVLSKADSEDEKAALKTLRNKTILWVLMSGLLLTAAYELTSGVWAPLAAFAVFIAGLSYSQLRLQQIINPRLQRQYPDAAELARVNRKNMRWCLLGMTAGYGTGLFGLIYGLIQSGRWQ